MNPAYESRANKSSGFLGRLVLSAKSTQKNWTPSRVQAHTRHLHVMPTSFTYVAHFQECTLCFPLTSSPSPHSELRCWFFEMACLPESIHSDPNSGFWRIRKWTDLSLVAGLRILWGLPPSPPDLKCGHNAQLIISLPFWFLFVLH